MAFNEAGLSVIATKLDDVELKDNIVVVMPKITEEGYYTCNIRVEYKWKPPSGNKKNNVKPTKEVSKSNPFEVLNSVENDVELVTNGGTSNLASQEANSTGSSFWNVDSSSLSITPVIEKIDKIEKLIIDGKVTLVDYEGKPLQKLVSSGDYDSEDEVTLVDNEMASFLAKKDGRGQEIPDKLQAICDNLDIIVRGHRKK
ncbi:hypothetical protein Tco_0290716 [Tanacetum coccineum]